MSAPNATTPVPASPEEIPRLVAAAFNRGSPDALLALYEPGAVLVVPPDGHQVSGLDAIRQAVEPLFGQIGAARIELVETLQAGDLAMTHAEWVLTGTDEDGAEVEMAGRGTVVSRRQPDGTWRVVFDDPVSS
jgi:uncharacterized protein (TIGR02246 family)